MKFSLGEGQMGLQYAGVLKSLTAVLTRDAARLTESFCFSVGLGDDFVMRLSVDSTENLRTNILDALHRCRLPKYRLMLNGFGYTLFGVPTGDLETTWKPEEASPSTLLGHSPLLEAAPVKTLANALVVLSSTTKDGEIEVRILVG
uniref:Uncharacterized protein n=1 Tax=Timema cristinae TaxID=61476 RepID=A0A7R9HDA7_TIMCR|nr:unnamed protein product [Timema cristinae]